MRSEGYCSWSCGVSVTNHLTSQISDCAIKECTYTHWHTITKNIVGIFLKQQRSRVMVWNTNERFNMLIRSSLLWLTHDKFFLFNVQRLLHAHWSTVTSMRTAPVKAKAVSTRQKCTAFTYRADIPCARIRSHEITTRRHHYICVCVSTSTDTSLIRTLHSGHLTNQDTSLRTPH